MQNPLHSDVFDLVTLTVANATNPTIPTLTCPPRARIQVISIFTEFGSTAVPHFLTVQGRDASGYLFGSSVSTKDQGVADTWSYYFSIGIPNLIDLSASNIVIVPLSEALILNPGEDLQLGAIGYAATETFNNNRFRCKQWVLP